MIKQIQLRGISRSPSDRYTSDGGCAESLNVHIEEQETAPTLPPNDVTYKYGEGAANGISGDILFIHKGIGYENLLFLESGVVKAYPENTTASALSLYTLKTGESINSVTSIGNTIIISTNQRMEYVLWKDSVYHDLGDTIPVPCVEFQTKQWPTTGNGSVSVGTSNQTTELVESFSPASETPGTGARRGLGTTTTIVPRETYDAIKAWDTGTWTAYLDGKTTASEYDESYAEVNNTLWDMVQSQLHYVVRQGYFGVPVFVRSALKLYDGSYIYQSVPVLLGTGDKEFFTARGSRIKDTTTWHSNLSVRLNSLYKTTAILKENPFEGWEDIVDSVELFLSDYICIPRLTGKIVSLTLNEDMTTSTEVYYDLSLTEADEQEDSALNEVLSKSVFYKIATFDINDTSKLQSGYDLLTKKEYGSQDFLVQQKRLPDDYLSFHKKVSSGLFRYNNKTILTGVSYNLSPGYQYLNGSVAKRNGSGDDEYQDKYEYDFLFYVRDTSNNALTVKGRNDEGGTTYTPYSITAYKWSGNSYTEVTHYARPYGWLAYPDPRCYRVDMKVTKTAAGGTVTTTYRTYTMETHPNLNCSYVFIGLDGQMGITGGEELTSWNPADNNTFRQDNVIWASVMDNPFVYTASGKITFTSNVISVANATKALSEGQFGQYPLYVFTEDGIWSLSINDEGDFMTNVPMSRDVAVSAKGIRPIDQAIVFVTESGVMLLQGSDVVSLSPFMNGRHYVLEESARTLLSSSPWAGLLPAVTDNTPFMSFVKEAEIAYDYVGSRLIFFCPGKNYQYVYMLKTQTWHKTAISLDKVSVLNSYPDCYVSLKADGKSRLYDFSTVLTSADLLSDTVSPVRGMVITRPFDLEAPDIRKAIRDIRIRGKYNRNDVRYILLGSMDGINWGVLPSLRGGSYKLFRMVILTRLSPTERITWVDIDFDIRFNNKLR